MREMPKYLKKWLLIFLKQIPFFVKTIVIDSHLDGITAPYGVLESCNVRMNMVQTVIRVLATGLDSKRPRIQSLTFRWNHILFNHHGYIVPRVNRRYYHLYWHFETKTFNRYPARVSYTEIKWKYNLNYFGTRLQLRPGVRLQVSRVMTEWETKHGARYLIYMKGGASVEGRRNGKRSGI
jgi:hypothetical protein